MSFNDVAIVSVKGNDYTIHFRQMSKEEAIYLLENADLTKKSETLQNIKQFIITYITLSHQYHKLRNINVIAIKIHFS